MPAATTADKKGHICPPSDATHPRDRWEALFVYAFIVKYTTLRNKVEGLNTPMDFEDALITREPNPVMNAILTRFIMNLRPNVRNISPDQLPNTIAGIFNDFFKSAERSVFWDEAKSKNVNPFDDMQDGFFASGWDLKLRVLRQLVELQLSHSETIKEIINRAWGVTQIKEKRKGAANASDVPNPNESQSQGNLSLQPIGQDNGRTRYWVIDDSPRIWTSTNPWKITAAFKCVSSTREEYIAIIEQLKASLPPLEKGKRPKAWQSHMALIKALEERMEGIDTELARLARQRKKREQREILLAQAELRSTRTRRQTRRPDYVYHEVGASDDEPDRVQEDDEDYNMDDEDDGAASSGSRRSAHNGELRRSSRAAQKANDWSQWRGERRSSRLGAPPEVADVDEPPPKRARTVDSIASDGTSVGGIEKNGKTELKPNEFAVEQIPGKKKSKFWFYAVETTANDVPTPPPASTDPDSEDAAESNRVEGPPPSSGGSSITGATDPDHSVDGSPSP